MFNAEKPSLDQLPGSAQLFRSTVAAAVVAMVVLFTVVLPAEYGIDPTGAGRVLGLTEMGQIKQELAEEAAQDAVNHGGTEQSSSLWLKMIDVFVAPVNAQESWRDELMLTLAPGDSAEIKLGMKKGDTAEYTWVTDGGRINYDLHAHGNGESATYGKGRGKTSGEGSITASFAGNHGWFWRNRDKKDVTVTIRLRGEYKELIRE